ncbi:solute carrier family 15 member 4-like [Sycon ciliatum]|uniref:solute carrier family 15 member 4-like n=1 Tax=Sycon ciliatum TaxID=27933 RepID=UPI0031F5F431
MDSDTSERQPFADTGSPRIGIRRRSWPEWHSSYTVLLVSLLERVGKGGLVVNLVQYLEFHSFLGWSSNSATIATLLCTKLSMLGAILSGLLADTLFGHYRVLLVSLLLQLAGSLLLLAAVVAESNVAHDEKHHSSLEGLVISGLVLFGLGLAGSTGTEIPLGVSQHALRGESGQQAKVFFPRYYWCINVGSMLGLLSGVIQVQESYHVYGYILPPVFYFLSVIALLLLNRTILGEMPSRANPISDTWTVAKEAIRVRWRKNKRSPMVFTQERQGANRLYWKDSAGSLANWVRYAEKTYGGSFDYNRVAKVHNFLSVLAVLSAMMFCQITLAQTLTSFVSQGNLMRLPIQRAPANNGSFHIPASSFTAFNSIGVLLGTPIVICVIYPGWQAWSKGTPPSHLKRITFGMMLAIVVLMAAAALEVERRKAGRWDALTTADHSANPHSKILKVSSLPIYYQVPQYTLSGLSEVFITVSALEFAYSCSPPRMKGIAVGLVYASIGLSSIVSVGALLLIHALHPSMFYVSDQQGQVYYYYIALAGIMLVGLVLFLIVSKRFKRVPIYSSAGASGGVNDYRAISTTSMTASHVTISQSV